MLAIGLELGDVVGEKEVARRHRRRGGVEVEVDREEKHVVPDPRLVQGRRRLAHDRARGDDDVGARDRIARLVDGDDTIAELAGSLGDGVVHADLALGIQRPEHRAVVAPLLAAPEHGDGSPAFVRERLHASTGRCRRPGCGDLRPVENRERDPGRGVVHDDQAADRRQAARGVVRVTGDPLHGHDVEVAQVRGHRVEEGIGAGMHADLRRHLDLAAGERPVHARGELHLLGNRRKRRRDGLAVDEAERRRHGAQ